MAGWTFADIAIDEFDRMGHFLSAWKSHGLTVSASPECLQQLRACDNPAGIRVAAQLEAMSRGGMEQWRPVMSSPAVIAALAASGHPDANALVSWLEQSVIQASLLDS